MIKMVCFDNDGVLVDSQDMHYKALNLALEHFGCNIINEKDHWEKYNGLSTKSKLLLLTKERGLPVSLHGQIYDYKQLKTDELIIESIKYDKELVDLFWTLKNEYNLKVGVVTNCIKNTTINMLSRLGVLEIIDFYLSNDAMINTKPAPEPYLRAMANNAIMPSETLVIEDSPHGILSARDSGAFVMEVKGRKDVKLEYIINKIKELDELDCPF